MAATAEASAETLYKSFAPSLSLRLQFLPAEVPSDYFAWPSLPDLLPVSFVGVKTSRDEFLIDVDLPTLEKRIDHYFDRSVSNIDIATAYPIIMNASARYDPVDTRKVLLERPTRSGKFVRYVYRPFDVRWLYWDPDTKILDEKRSEFERHVLPGAVLIEAREKEVGDTFARGTVVGGLADNFGNGLSTFFPALLNDGHDTLRRPNLLQTTDNWRRASGLLETDVFFHCVAIIHAPNYRKANDAALRIDWPRVPLPRSVETARLSASLGERLALLLDADRAVPGVTTGSLLPVLAVIGLPKGQKFALTSGWGSVQVKKSVVASSCRA